MTTILHVDPDAAALTFVQNELGSKYNIVPISTGPPAIQYCAMIQPDLILVSAALQDIDVMELTLRLKMFMPKTPILTLNSRERTIKPDSSGVDETLPHPLTAPLLHQAIKQYLPSRSLVSPQALPPESFSDTKIMARVTAQISALNQANQRLASLNTVSALIGTSLDVEHLTDEILQQIQKIINFDSATLMLLKGNILEAAASRGLQGFRQGLNVYSKSDGNSAWRVVNNKLPLIIDDVTQSSLWEPRPELSRVRSWLGVPLIYKDRVVGVLTLDKNEPDAFTDADARYVFTLAFQVAIAVENTQLFEEWENQAVRLKVINDISQEITTILDVAQLYHHLAEVIVKRLNYNRVAILNVDDSQQRLWLRACYQQTLPTDSLKIGQYHHSAATGLLGQVVQTARPVLAADITGADDVLPGAAAQSMLAVPIFVDNRVESVIYADNPEANGFDDQDLWTLSSLATHAAAVIQNARLYQDIDAYSDKLQRTVLARTQRLQAIKQMSLVISQSVSLDELLMFVGERISQIFSDPDMQTVQVATGLVTGNYLSVRVIYDDTPGFERQQEAPERLVEQDYRLDFDALIGQVLETSQPIILHNTNLNGLYHSRQPAAEPECHNTVLLSPLIAAGKTIGVIIVYSRQTAAFDEDDLETLESLAFQVASAIEYARLLRKTREMAIVDERTRLARDMHDGVAQNLAYLLIQVDRCLNMVEPDSRAEQQLEQIGSLLKQNIDELRRNIFDLRPIDLEGRSLFAVLENFVAEFGRRWNLKTRCIVTQHVSEVPAAIESSVYRILQEALSNAQRHSGCNAITVELGLKDAQTIVLLVEDDGSGFDPTALQPNQSKRGLGLISMQERVKSVGGVLNIDTTLGRGTRIRAELPLQPEAVGDTFQGED